MAKVIIVGGVAGGATVATRLRRLGEQHEIILFERDEFISFANCGLPYYIGNVIKDRQRLIVESVENMHNKFNIDVRNFSEVLDIDRKRKIVSVKNVKTGATYEETYDFIVLSPGAQPIVPPTPGLAEAKNVFTLRNIPDTDNIKAYLNEKTPQTAVVIGGGFIGIEMAENLVSRCATTIIDLADQILAPLDFEMAKLAQNEMEAHGIRFYLNDLVSEFRDEGHTLILKSGNILHADIVILGIGVKPENELAIKAGLKLGPRGHILTTKSLQALDGATGEPLPDIYAIGDAIEVYDYLDDTKTAIALAWPANRQGRLVADRIAGKDVIYNGSLGSSVVKVFDLVVASTGNNEKTLQRKKMPYRSAYASRGNHAGYYPGASDIFFKLLFDGTTGKILGAQAIGGELTEKRIDVIATAIRGGLTVADLPDIQLCYAPPYSSAKDPVNILGYIASNLMDGTFDYVRIDDIDAIAKSGALVIDARSKLEYDLSHIDGAINIPLETVRSRLKELPEKKETPIYVYCNIGHSAYIFIQVLRSYGYTKLYDLAGGLKLYKAMKPLDSHTPNIPLKNPEINEVKPMNSQEIKLKLSIDACGLQCPGPIMETYKAINSINEGEIVQIEATDRGFIKDIAMWCANTGNTLMKSEHDGKIYRAIVAKGGQKASGIQVANKGNSTTIVLFSGDMDKAMAAMIIGQGSAAMGKDVTIFCTFWGLNLLRREQKIKVKKSFIESMFGAIMPRGPKKMGISKMNFGGAGAGMMKGVMKKKNVILLDKQLKNAMDAGVKFIACTMSMDIMGIHREEVIDNVDFAGVATYLAESDKAGLTLFI